MFKFGTRFALLRLSAWAAAAAVALNLAVLTAGAPSDADTLTTLADLANRLQLVGSLEKSLGQTPTASPASADFVVTEVAGNFTWAENLRCQRLANGSGVLWASDDFGRTFWAISPPACPGCPYVKHKHLDESLGFSNFLGIAVTTKPSGDVYIAASKDKVVRSSLTSFFSHAYLVK